MLKSEMLEPLSVFALLESGCSEVVVFQFFILGFDAADEKRPEIKDSLKFTGLSVATPGAGVATPNRGKS
jgi:hypothetical protein